MVALVPVAAALVAATVTVWPVLQFDGVKVSDAGVADTVVTPAERATATVTLAVGAAERASLKVELAPGATLSEVASATIAGEVLASTKTGTSARLLLVPAASYAIACRW